jgi:hypothetical protein
MMGVIDGSETILPDDPTHIAKQQIWKKKDNLAKAMITQCVKSDLVIKVARTLHSPTHFHGLHLESMGSPQGLHFHFCHYSKSPHGLCEIHGLHEDL